MRAPTNLAFSRVKTWPPSAPHGSVAAASSGFFQVFVGLGPTET